MLINILNETNEIMILISMVEAIILGILIAITHKKTAKSNKNFLVTISLLPLIVTSVILIVNGNLGMSVAVAGTFGLIRFRSIAGTSKEILLVFFAMAVGLTIGAGYAILSIIITLIGCLLLLILNKITIFDENKNEKYLRITIPEDLDYTEVFSDILKKYTEKYTLSQVKTTNLGSLFELKYLVTLKNNINEKDFIDEIRIKNGNLKISITEAIDNTQL